MRTRLAALAVVGVTLVSCGGGGGALSFDSAKDVADAAGCDQFTPDDQTTLYAAQTGSCRRGDAFVTIDWFKDTDSRNAFKDVAEKVGGGGVVIYGENFAVTCLSASDCDAVENNLGGSWPD